MRAGRIALGLVVALAVSSAQASPIKDDEQVVLFPTAAHFADGRWHVPVHGWIFEPERGSLWRRPIVKTLVEALDLDEREDDDETRFRERIAWFMTDNERGKRIPIRIGEHRAVMSASGSDGQFRGELRLPEIDGPWLHYEAETRNDDARRFEGRVLLVPPEGISVISDIDDTIKITEVLSKRRTLTNTFVETYRAVPGMAALYEGWATRGAVFHYVSAGPWQLYPLLAEFFDQAGFPAGTIALRNLRLKDRSLVGFLRSSKPHKRRALRAILDRWPDRRFILVGDTSEHDPEIYAEIARAHPNQVAAVLLRRAGRWSERRGRAVTRGVRVDVIVFGDPAELPASLRALDLPTGD